MEKAQQQLIEVLAIGLGVKPNAILQWRWRKTVPHKWRLPIMAALESPGAKP